MGKAAGWRKGRWVALLALLAGCATAPSRPVAGPLAQVEDLNRRGRFLESLEILRSKQPRSPREELLLGESLLGLGRNQEALEAFYTAQTGAELVSPWDFRLQADLGDLALGLSDGFEAVARFAAARKLARGRAERDRSLVGQGRGELLIGRPEVARWLRRQVSMSSVAGLEALDAGLVASGGAAHPAASARGSHGSPALVRAHPRSRFVPPSKAPRIFSRGAWDARREKTSQMALMGSIKRITIHHGGEERPFRAGTWAVGAQHMRGYQSHHMDQRHWADVGYHFVIDSRGDIFQGRRLHWRGAHAGSPEANAHNVGICLMGNFNLQTVPRAQQRALFALVLWLARRYRIPPSRIYSHRAIRKLYGLGGTDCPGKNMLPIVAGLRQGLSRELARDARTGRATAGN